MEFNDQPATTETAARGFGGIRRTVATLALAAGLLTVGGVAVVAAASPDPSASAAPSATSQPSTGGSTTPSTRPGHSGTAKDCPNMGGSGGSRSGGSSTPTTPTPSTAPSTTAAPSSNL